MKKQSHVSLDKLVRRKHQLIRAITDLTKYGINILTINCQYDMPLIEVANSGGIDRLKAEDAGQGHNLYGYYQRKTTQLHGCQITWQELINY